MSRCRLLTGRSTGSQIVPPEWCRYGLAYVSFTKFRKSSIVLVRTQGEPRLATTAPPARGFNHQSRPPRRAGSRPPTSEAELRDAIGPRLRPDGPYARGARHSPAAEPEARPPAPGSGTAPSDA